MLRRFSWGHTEEGAVNDSEIWERYKTASLHTTDPFVRVTEN